MSGDDTRDLLIEKVLSAFRQRDASGRILPSPDWWDLSPEEREIAYGRLLESRVLEQGIDPGGLSSTAHAVLSRLPFLPQLFG